MTPAIKLKTWTRAVAVAAALVVAPASVAVAVPLSSAEDAQAQDLANSIVSAVMASRAASSTQSPLVQRQQVERAIEDVIIGSGATPAVAEAALRKASALLATRGVSTECPPHTTQADELYCQGNPVGLAFNRVLAAVSAQVDAGVSAVQRLTGPVAITSPPSQASGGGSPTYTAAPR